MPGGSIRGLEDQIKRPTGVVVVVVCALGVAAAVRAAGPVPAPGWAYPVTPATFKLPPDPGTERHVPGSARGFTQTADR